MSSTNVLDAGSLFAGEVRAYFAPVDRVNGTPMAFDAASIGRFNLDTPPAGWIDAGIVSTVKRDTGESWKAVWSGAPAMVKSQGRSKVEEIVEVLLPGWTRMAVALSAGTQTMNLLKTAAGVNANPSGGTAVAAEVVGSGSTATMLQLGSATAVRAGDVVVVDVDYDGATGYVGSGITGAYVATVPEMPDVDFVRRVSFNIARVLSVDGSAVTLASPLPAGVPDPGTRVSVVEGFVDRNGGSFAQEWSALFVVDGFQGDRLILHYPRLQPAGGGAAENALEMTKGVTRWRPMARMVALPVIDAVDGVGVVSFRSYLPAAMRRV
ncbi:hypothetical protein [Terriglobus sp. RCC_193]|uniref:hypothetical protein n=1 Tax=Terriglobus sp. RCC_193 TaxID=3239218 RepID=UPI003525D13F